MDRTSKSRLFQSLKAVRRRKGKIGAMILLGVIALIVVGSMTVPISGNEVSLSYSPIPIQPVKNFELAANLEYTATAFTDSSGDWGSETNAYDGDWGTFADNVIFANGDDYPSAYASGFDSGSSGTGTITQVDIIVRMKFLSSIASDEWGITLDVGASTDNVLWAMDKSGYGEANNTFTDVTEPNGGGWSWAEIRSAEIHLDSNKVGGKDNDEWSVYEFAFKVTTSGGAFQKDMTETVSAVDVQTNAADFDRSYTESVSASDVQTNVADFVRNLVETISVVGIISIAKLTTKNMVETVSASDVLTNTGSFVRDLTESVSVVDVISKAVGINMTEAISAVDSIDAYKLAVIDLVETITVSYVTTKDVGKNMIESISAIDAQSNAAAYVRDFVEAITAADVQTNAADFVRDLVEAITVVEIIDAYIVGGPITKNLSENITVADVLGTVGGTPVEHSLFYELFFSLEMWGYLGPIGLVICGYVVANKERVLGILFFVVECLFISHYLTLVEATPDYWWHTIIILFGGMLTIVYSLWDRR